MTEYTKPVLTNPANAADSIKAVLEAIIFYTEDGDQLVKYQILPDKVLLTFDGV